MNRWHLKSWLNYNYEQSVPYHDPDELDNVVNKLSTLPPLVSSEEVLKLKSMMIKASKGEAFILQGGDCAELFTECLPDIISNKLKIILQMSLILIYGLRKPVVRIGRIAGQYAKPRSNDFETINDVSLFSYRGDLINSPEFNKLARTPDPKLLISGYNHATMTLNFIRSLLTSGFASLHHPQRWDLSFFDSSAQKDEYQMIVNSLGDSLEFLETIDGIKNSNLDHVDFYTSHEALHLHYEQALTRKGADDKWYLTSTHFPWIGMRTAKPDSAHIEFLRGIENPVGIKIGPNITLDWLQDMIQTLNPDNDAGRIVLITRFGARNIQTMLPPLIEHIQKLKANVTWMSDPMHGNTENSPNGYKTRSFDTIVEELKLALNIHEQNNSYLGGVHFELTGENVTECIGGARGIQHSNLQEAYTSLVDPRLNYEQSLEMALQLSRHFKNN